MKLFISEKVPSLNRLSRTRKIEKISPLTQFSVRAILNRVYVQLDARPIKKDYKEIVYLWKALNLNRLSSIREKAKPHS